MTIDGFHIDDSLDLNRNINLLEKHLHLKHTFWGRYDRGVEKIRVSMGSKKVNGLIRTLYFILLLPEFIASLIRKKKIDFAIEASIQQLVDYYQSPKVQIRQFKAQCISKEDFYRREIQQLKEELTIQERNLNQPSIGAETKKEVQEVIISLKESIESKTTKFTFYQECVEKLQAIETQIQVKESLIVSKQKILELKDSEIDASIQSKVQEEFEIFESYGELLDGISNNLKRLHEEKEGLFDVSEVSQVEEALISSKPQTR
jgi:hypothetical protein